MYSRLFKGEISDAVCGHFDNFNDLLNAIQEKNFIQVTIEYYCETEDMTLRTALKLTH